MSKILSFIFVGPFALFMYCLRNGTKLELDDRGNVKGK